MILWHAYQINTGKTLMHLDDVQSCSCVKEVFVQYFVVVCDAVELHCITLTTVSNILSTQSTFSLSTRKDL